jgi:hypothetical protein
VNDTEAHDDECDYNAIVGGDRDGEPGHWLNAVNKDGQVLAVDGQIGAYCAWPPAADGMISVESEFVRTDAIYVDAHGNHLSREGLAGG